MWSFRKSSGTSVALIHAGVDSVGGALAWLPEGKPPVICATARQPVEESEGATREACMQAALSRVADELVRSGAPTLRDISGSGRVEQALIVLESPWAHSSVQTQNIQPVEPFIYTRGMESKILLGGEGADEAREVGETTHRSVVATLLNGYLIRQPFGKRANRASLIIFSTVEKDGAVSGIKNALLRAFHTRQAATHSFIYAATTALQGLYPHQKDFLVLSVTNGSIEAVSVKRGSIVDAGQGACGIGTLLQAVRHASGEAPKEPTPPTMRQPGYVTPRSTASFETAVREAENAWVEKLAALLQEFATRHALPRTIFLIADKGVRDHITKLLNHETLRPLWLSDEPVTAIALTPRQFASSLTHAGNAEGDAQLALLALFAASQEK